MCLEDSLHRSPSYRPTPVVSVWIQSKTMEEKWRPAHCFLLRTFNDAVVAFRAQAECLKRFLVSLAFVSRKRDIVAVELDDDSPLLQSGFEGMHLARRQGQKAPAE